MSLLSEELIRTLLAADALSLNVTALNGVLPTGAATAAKQDTGNTSLASILAAALLLEQPQTAATVTLSDSTTVAFTKGLWVGTGGDLAVTLVGGSAVTLKNVPSGTYVPGSVIHVMTTNTTASNVVGFS